MTPQPATTSPDKDAPAFKAYWTRQEIAERYVVTLNTTYNWQRQGLLGNPVTISS